MDYKRYAALIGEAVLVHGKLFAGHTGHHHTPLLLEVLDVQKGTSRRTRDTTRWTLRLDGIGPARIGMTLAQLNRALQENFERPREPEEQGCFFVEAHAHPQVSFMLEEGRLARIDVSGPGIRTDKGAQVGDSENRVRDLYGPKMKVEPHFYNPETGHYLYFEAGNSAIRFETENGEVFSFYAGRASAVAYVEGCS